ncbi:MAG: mechanosensitive ion channel family protein [Acidimicrobiia bacterium]
MFWDNFLDRLEALGSTIVEWAILILVAIVVLIIGRWIIRVIRTWIERLLGARALDGVWQRSGIARTLEGGGQTPAGLAATIVYAYLWVVLLLIVARILQVDAIEQLLLRLLAWIPLLLLAAVIIIVAAAAGGWTANLIRPFAREQGVPWLAVVVHVAIIVFGALFAMEIIRIDFAEDIVKIVIAASTIGLAIAFGVGGIDTARKWWAKYGTPSEGGGSRESAEPPTNL